MAARTSEMNTSFSFLQIRMVLLRAVPDVSHRHFTTEPLPHVITGKAPGSGSVDHLVRSQSCWWDIPHFGTLGESIATLARGTSGAAFNQLGLKGSLAAINSLTAKSVILFDAVAEVPSNGVR